MHFLFIKRIWLLISFVILIIGISGWYYLTPKSVQTIAKVNSGKVLDVHMVTVEFKTKTSDGTELEAYRFDPGTIYIHANENVNLNIHGLNGSEHAFHIEGTDIKGVVKKGENTVIPVNFTKEGIYQLICDTHSHGKDEIPMIAYIIVD